MWSRYQGWWGQYGVRISRGQHGAQIPRFIGLMWDADTKVYKDLMGPDTKVQGANVWARYRGSGSQCGGQIQRFREPMWGQDTKVHGASMGPRYQDTWGSDTKVHGANVGCCYQSLCGQHGVQIPRFTGPTWAQILRYREPRYQG